MLVEGPDGVGKTTVTAGLAKCLGMETFKCPSESKIFRDGQDGALAFDFMLTKFLEQTGFRFVSDRSYVSEWVYANAFGRDTDWPTLEFIDAAHAELRSKVLYLYSSVQPAERDELVPPEKYWLVKSWYDRFCEWTTCDVVRYDTSITLDLPSSVRAAADVEACLKLLGLSC